MADVHLAPERRVEELPPFLTIDRACEVAGCGRSKIYYLLGELSISAIKHDGRVLIATQSLLDHLASMPRLKIAPRGRRK